MNITPLIKFVAGFAVLMVAPMETLLLGQTLQPIGNPISYKFGDNIQGITVPANASSMIVQIKGADGYDGTPYSSVGGKGRTITATFAVTSGQAVDITKTAGLNCQAWRVGGQFGWVIAGGGGGAVGTSNGQDAGAVNAPSLGSLGGQGVGGTGAWASGTSEQVSGTSGGGGAAGTLCSGGNGAASGGAGWGGGGGGASAAYNAQGMGGTGHNYTGGGGGGSGVAGATSCMDDYGPNVGGEVGGGVYITFLGAPQPNKAPPAVKVQGPHGTISISGGPKDGYSDDGVSQSGN